MDGMSQGARDGDVAMLADDARSQDQTVYRLEPGIGGTPKKQSGKF